MAAGLKAGSEARHMVALTCSQCAQEISQEDVNVATDVAFCRHCNRANKLSALVHGTALDAQVDVAHPPSGAFYRNEGFRIVLGATHGSWRTALGALFVSLFWNGIVSVFVLIAIAGTLKHLALPIPDWFPAPDMNGSPMGLGMILFLWLFLTPFMVIGLAMIGAFLSALGGRTEVQLESSQGRVFTGIGVFGLTCRFTRGDVRDISVAEKHWRDSDGDARHRTMIVIQLRTGKQIRFGSMLTPERRNFVASALRAAIP